MISTAESRPTGQSSVPTLKQRPSQSLTSPVRRKRDEDPEMENSQLLTPPSPSKRQKVAFDSNVEVMNMEEIWAQDPLVIREQVRRAIQQHLNGNSEGYDKLKAIFKTHPTADNAPSASAVRIHLEAILANVSHMDKNCSGLVSALCQTEWVGKDASFVALYTRFLGTLAAAHSGYLSKIFAMLIELFAERKTRHIPSFPLINRRTVYKRAHSAIRYILRLVPTGSSMLSRVLVKRLQYSPSARSLEPDYTLTNNALKLLRYAPELRSEVLATITSEVVKVDVQVQVDLEALGEDMADDLVQDVATRSGIDPRLAQLFDDDTDVESTDGADDADEDSDEDDEDIDSHELRLRLIRANIDKIDSVIDLLFRYYDDLLLGPIEQRENTVELLLAHFHNIILPSHRSRHTQFLTFHFAQSDSLLIDRFATSCMSLIFDKRQPPVLRQAAAAYLASFVARGAHVPAAVTRDVFDLLGGQLDSMRVEYEPSCRGPDLRRYSSFYCMTQALLYIFCFRWKDLTSQAGDDDEYSDSEDEEIAFPRAVRDPLYQAIFSNLNPLRICSPLIVNEFARIAHRLNFMYVYTKMEMNKNVRLNAQRPVVTGDLQMNQPDRDDAFLDIGTTLEPYFPFDPYTLPRSKRWLEHDYMEWRGLPGEDEPDAANDFDIEDPLPPMDHELATDADEATGTDEDEHRA